MDVVVFELAGGNRCAVEMGSVDEVISLGPVTPVPSAPPAVLGAMNVRGQICPILRLEQLLEGTARLDSPLQGRPCLLVRARDCQVVFCVGRIEEVARLGRARVISSGGPEMLVSAVLDTARGTLWLVDVEQVVQHVTRQVRELASRVAQ